MGFAEYAFPNATHSRFSHSIGALCIASEILEQIFGQKSKQRRPPWLNLKSSRPQAFERLSIAVRLAALLHDIGHGPLSHTSERAMPLLGALKVPGFDRPQDQKTQATHEHYTLKIILNSSLTPLLERIGKPWGLTPKHLACIIEPELAPPDDYFDERFSGETVHYLPLLRQIVSSEIDADRMDYLLRDSFHAGVHYGNYDTEWLKSNFTAHLRNSNVYLALRNRALFAFEDFLISRFHMFLMVYFHPRGVIYDQMLGKFLDEESAQYTLPTDIEAYVHFDDHHLFSALSESQSEWAQRIVKMRPYRLLIELSSGLPQKRKLKDLKDELDHAKIPYIEQTSKGQISKYMGHQQTPIYVLYDNHFDEPEFLLLHECTDLFDRYRNHHLIQRLYVPENMKLKFMRPENTASLIH